MVTIILNALFMALETDYDLKYKLFGFFAVGNLLIAILLIANTDIEAYTITSRENVTVPISLSFVAVVVCKYVLYSNPVVPSLLFSSNRLQTNSSWPFTPWSS